MYNDNTAQSACAEQCAKGHWCPAGSISADGKTRTLAPDGKLTKQKYTGYFTDSFPWFVRAATSGTSSLVTSIVISSNLGNGYSMKYTGYLVPPMSGTYWLGSIFKSNAEHAKQPRNPVSGRRGALGRSACHARFARSPRNLNLKIHFAIVLLDL